MAKKAANITKESVASTSDSALLAPPVRGSSPKKLAVVGKGMRQNNLLLSKVLHADIQRWYPWSRLQRLINHRLLSSPLPDTLKRKIAQAAAQKPDAFIGWGHKKSFQRAHKAATRQNLNTLSIEDGFLRSLDSGLSSRYGVSVVIDDMGIYFDLTQRSRLEQLIIARTNNARTNNAIIDDAKTEHARAKQLMARICDEKLSKYNGATDCPSLDELTDQNTLSASKTAVKSHVLLIDQVAGDASIKGAGASGRQFKKMLKAACRNHPNAHIWIKAHPAAKSGHLSRLKLPKNVQCLTQALNPIELLAQVSDVYTVSSHMGFEALMLGKTVHCFGVSWYSGWGLTDDSGAPIQLLKTVMQRRRKSAEPNALSLSTALCHATLETLFYSAYIDYSHYVDPATKQSCEIETAIEWLQTNRLWQSRLEGGLTVYEFSRWKLPFVKDFLRFPRTTLRIKPKPRLKNLLHPDHFFVDYQQPLLVWGLAKRQHIQTRWQKKQAHRHLAGPVIYCMEDGFIRSNGLGATLLAPLSVVIDQQGIYYDATQPSDLETILRDCGALTTYQRTRIKTLQQKLLKQRVSKYNVGGDATEGQSLCLPWTVTAAASKKRRILIIGQVEDDLSVQHCGSMIKTNTALIARVCQDNPEAYLIYKPHPDVEAGLRVGKVAATSLCQVQAVAYDTAMPDCLECVDEVHTISSLTGFEALLRGLSVTCYGLPFYAGWGLTRDCDTQLSPKSEYIKRRTRETPLTLEQLLYGVLIRYPLYRLPDGHGLAQVEQVIDHLYPPSVTCEDATSSTARRSIKRRIATRFMQQRHRWQQLRRKLPH